MPQVKVRVLDAQQEPLTDFGQADGPGIDVPVTGQPGTLIIKPEIVGAILNHPRFFLEFTAVTPAVEYAVDDKSVSLSTSRAPVSQ